jgi:hypothetical protein
MKLVQVDAEAIGRAKYVSRADCKQIDQYFQPSYINNTFYPPNRYACLLTVATGESNYFFIPGNNQIEEMSK